MQDNCFAGMKPEKGKVSADGVRICYYVWENDGPDMVMMHGITSSALTWWRVAPEMARAGYRVTALDMPGHGDSDCPDRSHSLSETAHIVDVFMAALEIRSPIVMGHSWGGGVTLVHATNSRTRIVPRSIVLIDPLIRTPPGDVSQYRDALLELLGKPRPELATLLRDVYPNWHECDVYWKAEALEKGSPSVVRGVFSESLGLELVSQLLDVPGPWALIAADPAHGGILSETMWTELREAAENNQGHMFHMDDVGHDIYREDFNGFMAHLNTFLGSVT
jgi:pimeloyl-ACP methyl ester carboxylesterase